MIRKRLAELCRLELSELDPILSGRTEPAHAAAPQTYDDAGYPPEFDDGFVPQRRFKPRDSNSWRNEGGNGRGNWKKKKGNWRDRDEERPRLTPRVQPDMVQGLLQLLLFEPVLATRCEPVWQNWPAHGDELLQDVLQSARTHGARMNSAQLLELWRMIRCMYDWLRWPVPGCHALSVGRKKSANWSLPTRSRRPGKV